MNKKLSDAVNGALTDKKTEVEFIRAAYPELKDPVSAFRKLIEGRKKFYTLMEIVAIKNICGISIDGVIDEISKKMEE